MRKLVILAVAFTLVIFGTFPVSATSLNSTTTLIDQEWPVPGAPKSPKAGAVQFATVIDDLPLMPGLSVDPDGDLIFSTSTEQLKQTRAVGSVDIDDVYRFYAQTLPQMGWTKIDARRFRRDQDLLRIDAKADEKSTRVAFTITPIEP